MSEKNTSIWKGLWEDFYDENIYTMWYPGEPTIRLLGKLSKSIDLKGLNGLDIGCGVGRNTILMSNMGLKAHGIDISKNAIKLAKKNADNKGVKAKFIAYDGKTFPFKDSFFDVIISIGVLDHMPMKDALDLMEEIKRTLKPNGVIELDIHSIYDLNYGVGELIEKNVHIIEEGDFEIGLPQHFFSNEEVLTLTEGFEIETIYLHEYKHFNKEDFEEIGTHSKWVVICRKK